MVRDCFYNMAHSIINFIHIHSETGPITANSNAGTKIAKMEKKFAFSSEQFFGLICSTVSPLSIRIQGASLGPIIGLPLSRIRFGFGDAVDAAS